MHRFYVPSITGANRRAPLPRDEAVHATRVLRLRPGAMVRVFDGCGREYVGRLDVSRHGDVGVHTLDEVGAAPEPRIATTLAQAVLKGRKFDSVVKDATMLGVRTIWPLFSDNADVTPAAGIPSSLRKRWTRIAVASAKQSQRAVVPAVHPATPLSEFLGRTDKDDVRLIFVEPNHHGACLDLRTLADCPAPSRAVILVGPEGGWTAAEVERAIESGYTAVTLGSRTLRADAMAIAALSVLGCAWGDL